MRAQSKFKPQLYLFYLTSVLAFSLFTFLSCFAILEWWKVSIEKKTLNYVFNGMPWYYESPQLYAKVMLIEGLFMFVCLLLTTYFIVKKRNLVYLMFLSGLVYSFLIVAYGQTV